MALYFLLFDLFLKYLESPLISVLSWGNCVCTLIDYNASSSVSTTFSTQILSTCAFWCGSPWYKLHNIFLKHWPNGVASYRKLKTCINLRLRLVMTWVYLRWLAFTFIELKFARKWTQVFHRLAAQRKSTQAVLSIVFLCPGALKCTEMAFLLLALNLRLHAIPFGHSSQVCVRKFTFPNLI